MSIHDELVAILFREDPIGLNFGVNPDEYMPEVEQLLPKLPDCAGVEDVVRVTHETFVEMFDQTRAGDPARYQHVAALIWNAWSERRAT